MRPRQPTSTARASRARDPILWVCALALSAAGAFAQDGRREPIGHREIDRRDLEAAVRTLASDELAGRSTGSPQAVIAARWLAERLEQVGVEPAGDEGGYLQRVPMFRAKTRSAPRLVLATAGGETISVAHGVDFDRVEGARSSGKLRVVLALDPASAPTEPDPKIALVVPQSTSEQRKIFERSKSDRGAGFGLVLTLGPDAAGKPTSDEDRPGRLQVGEAESSKAAPRARVRAVARDRLHAGEVATAELVLDVEAIEVDAFNVVGKLAGRGDASKGVDAREAIVVSAHYDHLAPRAPSSEGGEDQDLIHNGADDDASGCAAVLELAQALAQGERPARTVIFFLATGEEEGLLGTSWYIDHPVAPLADTVLNLNFEMIGRPDPLVGGAGKLWLTGYERTNLGPAWTERGLAIARDPRPEQNFFERSDNMAFVRRGIVGVSLSSFNMHGDYHGVDDEAERLDYAHMEAAVREAHDALRAVADGELRPQWSAGFAPAAR